MDSIRYMVSFLHCGFVAIEPDTRHIKAWVGDIDFDSWKYDKVTAMRQPGSTFKLFVYAEAMNKGLNPCDRRMDAWTSYTDTIKGEPKQWAPHNANGTFSGANMTLKLAFAQSVNSIAVKLGYEVGIRDIIRTAQQMGIHSNLEPVPSLSLGASDVSLLELVNSYCTVVDNGLYADPIMVTRIEDREGNVIYESETHEKRALSERTAYFMQQLLRGGLTEPGGTTAALWQYIHPVLNKAEFGGKTGTSNNHSDAWFVGVNPKLVCGAWVGGEYRAIHFRTGALGQGSRTALPICGAFYEKVLSDPAFQHYHGKFAAPKNQDISASMYQCDSYYYTPSDTLYTDSLGGWDVEEQWEQDETDEPEQETDQESTTSPNTPESPTTPTPPNP
jgi:penicillin-binding protein 1A